MINCFRSGLSSQLHFVGFIPDKMFIRHLRIALLLIVFPGTPHAQSAAQSCHAPKLDGGFFAPKQETYSDGAKLTYACDEGLKPTVKGWWATSTCQNGKWSHKPQCIDQNGCFPPDLPNAKYKENPSGWYRNGHRIRITCDNGYEPKSRHVIATCIRGTWHSVPVCEKHVDACGEPPKIPHAVIIQKEYQEVFAADSEVQFECEGGYTVEGTDTKNSIMCIFGNWTEGPTCISSSTSGSKERDSTTLITTVDNCGAYPVLSNGDVVEKDQNFLKYQCNAFYKLAGSDTVVCYSDGSWSQLPICKEAFCVLDPAEHDEASFRLSGVEYLKDGEEKDIPCIQQDHSSRVQCTNGKLIYNKCAEKAGSAEVETAAGNATSTENGAQTEAVHVGDRLQLLPVGLSQWMKGVLTAPDWMIKRLNLKSQQVAEQILGTEAPQSEKQAGDTLHQLAVGHNLQVEPTGSSNTSGSNESDSKPLITSGSSTTSASNERDRRPLVTSVNHCGAYPKVPHGDVVQKHRMYLKYQCGSFYTHTGPDTVVCYSDGSWSELPICKEAFCVIDPALYRVNGVQLSGVEYIKEGENKDIPCIWYDYSSRVQCTNGILHYTQCCQTYDHLRGVCRYYTV